MNRLRVKADIYGRHIDEIRKFWGREYKGEVVIDTMWFTAKILPICYRDSAHGFMTCQGTIEVLLKRGEIKIKGDLKAGYLTWSVGRFLTKNSIVEFIRVLRVVLKISEILMPIIDLLPTEDPFVYRRWGLRISLIDDKKFEYPEFIKKEARGLEDYYVVIPRL